VDVVRARRRNGVLHGGYAGISVDDSGARLIDVAHLTKTFGHVRALEDVSLSVRPGEVLGLIGPNGSGKTTLFQCIAGLQPRDHGHIRFDGVELSGADAASHLFYLPEGITPWPAQTLGWALQFVSDFFGRNATAPDDVAGALQLHRLTHRRLGTLSKGERKRALLAIGLLTPHSVLLADEPFDGLDLRQTRDVTPLLRGIAARGRTLFLSIHQIGEAARVCDRFVLLSGGRVCGEGTFDELSALAARRSGASHTSLSNLEEVFLALT
jgi:ABC-type multidrug transport system ATPase subunit